MNFLKSAVASAIAQGPPFPYSFGDQVDIDASIWTLYNGTRREDGSNCSIFTFDAATKKSLLPLAKNALKKLRTMRHPGVVKVLDTVETESYIYIATERITPLRWHVKRKSISPETAKWGLYSVARTVKFINDEASSVHGSLRVASVYTSESGEWKLGGFEVLSNVKDDEAIIYTYGSLAPDAHRYAPPELARSGWDAIKKAPHAAVDAYNFGTFIFEVFNGDYNGSDQAGQTKNIPPSMHQSYKRLVMANPKTRITVGAFLDQGRRSGGFFDSTLIKLTDGIDNLGVKTPEEREEFLDQLDEVSEDFPEDFFKMKVLPELLKSIEFGGGGPKALAIVMKISTKLSNEDFDSRVQPVIVRLFGNPDRALRVALLDNLGLMIDRLSQKVVNDKIFPQITSGFTDLAPVVREQTLKSVLVIIGKLSDRTINGELLRHLAKTANDEQPGIRTNTTICLGKIAKNLGVSTRSKVLIAAFSRSLRDPFVHARNAALLALAATGEHFSDEDCATKLLPAVCPSLLDKEKLIRDQANKTVDIFMQKIRKAASQMPDSVLPPPQATAEAPTPPRMSTPQPNQSSGGSGWAGWAISSFTNQLSTAAGEMETSSNGTTSQTPAAPAAVTRTASPSAGPDGNRKPTPTTTASALHRQAVASPPPPQARSASGMSTPAEAYFEDNNDEEAEVDDDGFGAFDDGGADAWGEMGDMDDDDGNNNNNTYFDAPTPSTTTKSKPAAKSSTTTPYAEDDGSEPDFAGWLAAKTEKKKKAAGLGGGGSGSKPLPKGLTKKSTTTTTPTTATARNSSASAPAPKKKIDLKPKKNLNDDDDDDDDGWGDGW